MKAIVSLGPDIKIEIEEADDMKTLFTALNLARYRKFCAACKRPTKVNLQARKSGKEGGTKYIFIENVCMNPTDKTDENGNVIPCWAKSGLGQYKEGGFYWKEHERWEGSKEGATKTISAKPSEDIPF